MVDMMVGVQNGVAATKVLSQGLLPQIRRCVDEDDPLDATGIHESDRSAGPGPGITWISRSTDGTVAGDGGNAGRRP